MIINDAHNVEMALRQGFFDIDKMGQRRPSRNGDVMQMPGPHTTVYQNPTQRVLFSPARDANPYFHFMECLWMLAGRNDVEWLSQFSSNIANFSDDGVTFHGAYGHRWREHFEDTIDGTVGWEMIDQLGAIADLLRKNKQDRRVVLQMWDPTTDLAKEGKDFPCNLTVTFSVNTLGKLDMMVFNRSNDMIWGAYGANAVHFSFLQEVMAAWIGVPIGRYWQVSANHHAYVNTLEKHQGVYDEDFESPYVTGEVAPYPVIEGDVDKWFSELSMFMDEPGAVGFQVPFFRKVAAPMYQSWSAWKDKNAPDFLDTAVYFAHQIQATDWRKACLEWLERRDV